MEDREGGVIVVGCVLHAWSLLVAFCMRDHCWLCFACVMPM